MNVIKNGKRLTLEQRKLVEANGLDSNEWLVSKNTTLELLLVHKDTGLTMKIKKHPTDGHPIGAQEITQFHISTRKETLQ